MKSKYCTLFLVRHGETDWNLKELLQGHTDIPLNKTGEKQAKELANKLHRIKFAISFSSDLLRARRTAEIIATEKKIAVKTTKVLRERRFGRFEGIAYNTHKEYQNLIQKFIGLSYQEKYKSKPYEGTESNEELMIRFIPFIREISVAYPGKNILVVTHGGLMRAFLNHLNRDRNTSYNYLKIANTAYLKIQSDGSDFFVKETSGIKTD